MTEWIPGMFYDVGGAAALFWPDQHPEHPDPELAQRWIVFDPWGGMEVVIGRPPREDAPIEREMGLVPFLTPPEELKPTPGFVSWKTTKQKVAAMRVRALWQHIRDTPTEQTIDEMREEVNAMRIDPETEEAEEQRGRGDTHNGPTFPDRSS